MNSASVNYLMVASLFPALHLARSGRAKRWSTTLSSKVDLPQLFFFRALGGANHVTLLSKFEANETRELHHEARQSDKSRMSQDLGPSQSIQMKKPVAHPTLAYARVTLAKWSRWPKSHLGP